MLGWTNENRIAWHFIAPGKPMQNGRSGGQQTVRVVHQHVTVNDGAQAVVAGEMNTRQPTAGRRKRAGEGRKK
jgi:hypothetical protein